MQKRGVLTLAVDLFGLTVDGHSCSCPEPFEMVMRNVSIAVDSPTLLLGPVALMLPFDVATRGVILAARIVIPMDLLLVPTRLFVARIAFLVAVCPDRRGGGRQKQDDRQETDKAAGVGKIDFHSTIPIWVEPEDDPGSPRRRL